MRRRAFLATAGAATLAGCGGVVPPDDDTDADGSEPTADDGTDPALPTRTVENFESGSLDAFRRTGGDWTVAEGDDFRGDRFLAIDGTHYHDMVSMPGDGLRYYPEPGDVVEGYVSLDVADHVVLYFGVAQVDVEGGFPGIRSGYALDLSPYEGAFQLKRHRLDDDDLTIDRVDVEFARGTVYRTTVEWGVTGPSSPTSRPPTARPSPRSTERTTSTAGGRRVPCR